MDESSLDACLLLVSDRRRRQIIRHLRHSGDKKTVDGLVSQLLDTESQVSESPDRKHLGIQLRHSHLPMLADYGVVQYDPESETVRYASDELVETVLDSLPEGSNGVHA